MPTDTSIQARPFRRKATVIAACLVWLPLTANAFGTLYDQSQDPLPTEFKALDKNRDGHLSREEANRDSEASSGFGIADRNHDGKLNEEEYVAYKSELQQARMREFLEDSTVTAKIKTELLKDTGIKGLSISVETHRGIVILSGFVDSEFQIHRATEIASGIRGVVSIKNSLILKG